MNFKNKIIPCMLALALLFVPLSVSALCGDANGDGKLNARDYLQVKHDLLQSNQNTRNVPVNADANGDGRLNAKDYMMIKRHVLGTYSLPDQNADPEMAILTELLTLINAERQRHGARPLVLSAELSVVAYDKSADMAQINYFSHTSPVYGTPFDMLDAYNVVYKSAGENIAAGHRTVQQVFDEWMNSASHSANILSSEFTHLGIGVAYGGTHGIYWTLVFCEK